MSEKEKWTPCPTPAVADIIRWDEPLWDKPNKPRGKPNKIGEQRLTGRVLFAGEFFEIEVLTVVKLTARAAHMNVKAGDTVRRKKTSIALGSCHKQID